MTKPKKRSHHKKSDKPARSHHKKVPSAPKTLRAAVASGKASPKTLYAAVDKTGSVRFSSSFESSIDLFIGKLKKFYRVEVYDLREPQRHPNKAAAIKAAKERA